MSYQDNVSQMHDAGFSGQEVQNWSDNQAVQLRQAGFNQDEVDSYQGMKAPAAGTPPVYGRVPTDKDFSNAASVVLGGKDHPFYEKAVDSLKGLFSDTGINPEEAVKASQTIPAFRDIMENGGEQPSTSWSDYGKIALRSAGSGIASQMQGLAVTQAYSKADQPLFDIEPGKDPEKYALYQKGVAFQKWLDEKLPESSSMAQAEKNSPIKTGIVSGLAQLPELVATGGLGMAATGSGSSYQEAKDAGATPQKATDIAGKSGMLWGVLGVADVGAFLKPVERSAPGILPWLGAKAAQAVRSGTVFAGTNELGDYLSKEISTSSDIPMQYKPTLQRIVTSALTGALAGALAGVVAPTGVKSQEKPAIGAEQPIEGGQPPEAPPPGATQGAKLTPVYHFDSDSYGLQNDKGQFTQTGFPSEEAAAKAAEPKNTQETPSRLEPEVIDRYKKTVSEQAEKLGFNLTPEQLQNASRVMAESHNPPEVQPETPLYDKIPQKPLGLADWVRKQGGISDKGGDVRSAIGGGPGLISSEGRDADELAQAAQEHGFFPESQGERPTRNEFIDKLNEDLTGNHQHSEHDADAAEAYRIAITRNSQIDQVSHETGVDTQGKTHQQFWDEVEKRISDEKLAEQKTSYETKADQSWRTESLEPEELEGIEHEYQARKDADNLEPIPARSGEPRSTSTTEGRSEKGVRSVENGAEISGHGDEQTAEGSRSTARGDGSVKLPRDLSKSNPRYGFGSKQFTLSFDNDIDKALYIAAQKTPSKRDADFRKFLKDNGFTDSEINTKGREIRDNIKRMARDHEEFGNTEKVSNIKVEDQHSGLLYQKLGLNRGILSAVRDPQHIELLKDVDDYLKRVLPEKYTSETTPGIIKDENGNTAYGLTDRTKSLITLSLQSPDQRETGSHEALHAVKDLLTDKEWKVLNDEAQEKDLRNKYDIDKRYDSDQEEETIAHWYADWQKDRIDATPESKSIFEKIKDIFSNIAAKIRSVFGDMSSEDVFKKIESGEVGHREGDTNNEGKLYQKEKEPITLGDAVKGIRDTFSPTSAGEKAKQTEVAIRGSYGEAKREQAIAETALGEFARQANEMKPEDHVDFYNYVEGRSKGVQLENKQFQAMADAIRKVYGRFKDILQSMPETRMMNFVTDYFTHQWAPGQDEEIKQFMTSWWQQGSGKNLKERKIPTIADGLEAGLKLEEPNPVRAVSSYVGSMSNYIASVKVLRAINNDLGGGYYADGKQPAGYAALVGRNAERIENARIDPESGKIVPARSLHLYAPQQVADLYNAFYSKGFEDTKLGSAYKIARGAINANTMLELGLSAYHFSTITMQSLNQDMGRILRNAVAGDWSGVASAVQGLFTPIMHFSQGSKLMDQYKGLADHGIDMEKISQLFAQSNLRTGVDPLSNVSTHGGFYTALQRGELPQVMERLTSQLKEGYGIGALKSGAEAVSRVISDVSHPLFSVYIPAIKMSAFHDLMGDWLRQNSDASDGEIAATSIRIGDMIEDRFGEMNMENLFWNTKAKQAMGLLLRAPGWDLGLVRQVGGAGADIYKILRDGIKDRSFDPKNLDRPLFMVGAVLTYAAINSALTYLHTGVAPSDQKLKDLIAYATGGLHKAFGENPERAELPGHGRELIQMSPNPGEGLLSGITQETSNKVATLPKRIAEASENKDWNGKPIYDPKSPNWYQRIPGVAQAIHIASGFEPFSIEQSTTSPEGSHLSLAERFMGVRSAGAKIVNPEGMKKFNEKKH